MKKAIATGGAGFIGSNLTAFLLKKGWKVKVIDNFSVGRRENLLRDGNLEIVKADIRDQKRMIKEFAGYDRIFHLAVQCVRKSINDPFLVHEVNSSGTLSVLEAARRNKIQKFIYVSSSEVYGTAIKVPMSEDHPLNPTTIYGASKLAGEYYTLAYLRTYGLPVVIVRPFNTYGYNSHFEGPYGEVIPRFVLRALNGLPMHIFGDGEQTRDFTFIDDTVRGIWLASKKGKIGEIYNLASGKETSVNSLSQAVTKLIPTKSIIKYLKPRPGDVGRLYANIRKAKKVLGFKPRISISEGLRMYIEWFQKTYHDYSQLLKLYEEKNW